MEDISRELEREIARAKPAPFKTSRRKKVLVVDDYGEMRSGTYLKVLVYFLSLTSLVALISAGLLFYFYSKGARENTDLRARVEILEKKTGQLTTDKEILMARLVMAGKTPTLETEGMTGSNEGKGESKKPKVKAKSENLDPQEVENAEPEPESAPVKDVTEAASEVRAPEGPNGQGEDSLGTMPNGGEAALPASVAVEKFTIGRGTKDEELQIRFDIRNTKKGPGGISGHIFTVLMPENGPQSDWVVVPKVPMEEGLPSIYQKGHYFSISRFKPVQFTVPSAQGPETFKSAAIYIFDENGGLMLDTVIDIEQEN